MAGNLGNQGRVAIVLAVPACRPLNCSEPALALYVVAAADLGRSCPRNPPGTHC